MAHLHIVLAQQAAEVKEGVSRPTNKIQSVGRSTKGTWDSDVEWNSGTYRIEVTLIEVTQDNTYRWRVETRARNVAQRTTFYDRFVLYNARWSTDIYKDPDLFVAQQVVVDP